MNYFELIERWATDRNLIEGSSPIKQTIKLLEELGELAGGMAKGKKDIIKDSLGDVVVVLTILAKQTGLKIRYGFADKITNPEYLIIYMSVCISRISSWAIDICYKKETYSQMLLDEVMISLSSISLYYGYPLEEAISKAWNEIKDRKGRMIDGIFVKEEDL